MGLSNEERNDKIFWALNRIYQIAKGMPDHWATTDFKASALNVWKIALSNSQNSAHWILGSSSGSSTVAECGLFEAAIRHCKATGEWEKPTENDKFNQDLDEKMEKADVFKKSVSELLKRTEHSAVFGSVFEIYQWTEQYFYAVNRYEDEMSRAWAEVSKLLADLQGMFYNLMTNHGNISKAWLLEQVLDFYVYRHLYSDKHMPAVFYRTECLHHDMSIDFVSTQEIFSEFKKVQFKSFEQNMDMQQEALLFILKVCGRRFHYDHQHKKLLDAVAKHNLTAKKKISLEKVKSALANCKKQKEKEPKYQSYCHLTGQES